MHTHKHTYIYIYDQTQMSYAMPYDRDQMLTINCCSISSSISYISAAQILHYKYWLTTKYDATLDHTCAFLTCAAFIVYGVCYTLFIYTFKGKLTNEQTDLLIHVNKQLMSTILS